MWQEKRPRGLRGGLTLTRKVALLSLLPMLLLGAVLDQVLQARIVDRTLAEETQAAQLIARIGIQPALTPSELRNGLGPGTIAALDRQLRTRSVKRDLARIKIWNAADTVVYSDDHTLIGRRLAPSDELELALAGRPRAATVVYPRANSETAGEVGLGTLIEVYVPLRFSPAGRPAGAFEMYLSYRPVAGAIASDKRTIAMLVALGLALLWLVLYRIVASASRRLSSQARENYRLAHYDQLTGLPNRTLFARRIRGALGRGGATAAVLVLDIDGFKQINSTLGAGTGDQVLREVGARLAASAAEQALAARLGNDEFALLYPRTDGAESALVQARAAQRAIEEPIVLDGVTLNVEVSGGVAVAGGGTADAAELLGNAEAALARARAGGSRLELYSPELDRFDPAQLLLLGQVRGALERGEFVLHYQAKQELSSGRIVGAEALLRWEHPERGLLAPMEFIPLIEPTALVGPLALLVVDLAAAQLVRWRERGIELELSVNLSARNLLDSSLPEQIIEILHRRRVPARALTVEVTESATMSDPVKAAAVLTSLREQGIGVSIDDFGTGNASIDYLARLPADEIKIDKSFVTGICDEPRTQAIVRSTIDLAHNLELSVVAEGVETPEVLELLASIGCDVAQGYLISRPLPAVELTALLEAGAGDARTAAARRPSRV